jgi:hypothetical protein
MFLKGGMGVKKLSDDIKVVDACGYLLFGEENYSKFGVDGSISNKYDDINLYKLSEILNDEFPSFFGYLTRVNDLYEKVMHHSEQISDIRTKHQTLDLEIYRAAGELVNSEKGKKDLFKILRNEGNNWIRTQFMMYKKEISGKILEDYICGNLVMNGAYETNNVGFECKLDYIQCVKVAKNMLIEEYELLESIAPEMSEFYSLLITKLRRMALSNRGQMILLEQLGPRAVYDSGNYFERIVKTLPPYCQRFDELRRLNIESIPEKNYIKDDLTSLILQTLLVS